MDALGCPSTSEQALQPAPVHVHDPEPIVDSSRPSATEDDPAVAGAPSFTPEQSVLTWPTWCRSLPSLFITNNGQTSGPFAISWRMRAMRLPSRDQAGACSPVVVNCWRRPFG